MNPLPTAQSHLRTLHAKALLFVARFPSPAPVANVRHDDIGLVVVVRILSKTLTVETKVSDEQTIQIAEFLVGDNSGSIALVAQNGTSGKGMNLRLRRIAAG